MNPRINIPQDNEISKQSQASLNTVKSALGMIPNLHKTLAHSEAALSGYLSLSGAMSGGVLNKQLKEQIAVASAGTNDCSYCASAHTLIGKNFGIDSKELDSNLRGESRDTKTQAVINLVNELIATKGDVDDATLKAVRSAGFSEAEIVEISVHVGMNILTNMFNRLARTEIDFPIVATS